MKKIFILRRKKFGRIDSWCTTKVLRGQFNNYVTIEQNVERANDSTKWKKLHILLRSTKTLFHIESSKSKKKNKLYCFRSNGFLASNRNFRQRESWQRQISFSSKKLSRWMNWWIIPKRMIVNSLEVMVHFKGNRF